MSDAASTKPDADTSRRNIFIVVGLITAILIAGMIYWATRPHVANNSDQQPRLENALRPGAPEFDHIRQRLVVDFNPNEDATESTRPLGDIVMIMTPTVRNFTGRTIDGLELHVTVVDLENKPVRERTVIVVPNQQTELETNKFMKASVRMEGFKKQDVRANIKIEVSGVKFK